jgi:hypothetical protein
VEKEHGEMIMNIIMVVLFGVAYGTSFVAGRQRGELKALRAIKKYLEGPTYQGLTREQMVAVGDAIKEIIGEI